MGSPDNTQGSGALCSLRGVSAKQNGEFVLQNVDMDLSAGHIHALVGGNGSSKSALCDIVAGESVPEEGIVQVGDALMTHGCGNRPVPGFIIKVPKTPQLFPHLTVSQNLVAGLGSGWPDSWRSWRSKQKQMEAWLDGYGINLKGDWPLEFVPREDWMFIQMLNLVFRRPKVFVIDETLQMLSPEQRGLIWPVFRRQVGDGMAVLWATCSLDDALNFATRISVLHRQNLLFTEDAGRLDRLSLTRLCYRSQGEAEDASLENFHQMLCFTEAALRDLPTAVVVVDNLCRIRFANRCAADLLAVDVETATGAVLTDLASSRISQLLDILRGAIDEAGETDADVHWHNQPYSSGMGNHLVDIRVRIIRERARLMGFMIVVEDVSLREELRRQLTFSENMASIGILAAGVAHEVNNPVAIIGNYSRYLRGKVEDGEQCEAVAQIETQSRRIQKIIQDLTAFSTGRVLGKMAVDICGLARDLCHVFRNEQSGKSLRIVYDAPDTPIHVMADPNDMKLIILNLLRNSVDAVADCEGVITVSVTGDNIQSGAGEATISVRDNGPGIEFSDPNQVFLPFMTTKKSSGIHQGIGLFIVHKIVNKYKGNISAMNLNGSGCQFTVSLQRYDGG